MPGLRCADAAALAAPTTPSQGGSAAALLSSAWPLPLSTSARRYSGASALGAELPLTGRRSGGAGDGTAAAAYSAFLGGAGRKPEIHLRLQESGGGESKTLLEHLDENRLLVTLGVGIPAAVGLVGCVGCYCCGGVGRGSNQGAASSSTEPPAPPPPADDWGWSSLFGGGGGEEEGTAATAAAAAGDAEGSEAKDSAEGEGDEDEEEGVCGTQ
mmetsp:Transcript_97922/g.304962  ORF Transcript_97922/g.304962 Transcript_97922/m.304962 type:complete len:213 (-) Transcript_97922:54-692(-)